MEGDVEDEPKDVEEFEDVDEDEEEEEISPLYTCDLIPSPRPPIRRMAPDTATPCITPRSTLSFNSSQLIPDPSPLPPPQEDEFTTPLQTPERSDTEAGLPSGDVSSLEGEDEPIEDTPRSDPREETDEGQFDPIAGLPQEDDEIQTSPMDLLYRTTHQETSVQTTPGLALRQGGSMPTRVPFETSLLSFHEEVMTPPTSGEEMGGESSSEQTGSQDEGQVETGW